MRSANSYENARFSNFEPAKAVDDPHAVDRVFFVKQLADFAHFRKGHRFVRFVNEIERGPVVGLIADEAIESDDGAVAGGANVTDKSSHVDGLVD